MKGIARAKPSDDKALKAQAAQLEKSPQAAQGKWGVVYAEDYQHALAEVADKAQAKAAFIAKEMAAFEKQWSCTLPQRKANLKYYNKKS